MQHPENDPENDPEDDAQAEDVEVVARFYAPLRLGALDVLLAALQECVGTQCYLRGSSEAAWEVITRGEPLPEDPSFAEQLQAVLDEAAARRSGL